MVDDHASALRVELQTLSNELREARSALESSDRVIVRLQSDLDNVLNEPDLAVLLLDGNSSIRRMSPAAQRLFAVATADGAPPFHELATRRGFADLPERVAHVLESLLSQVFETQDERGRWYRVGIRPYKLDRNTVDGVVVFLTDIDAFKRLLGEAQSARAQAERGNRARDGVLAVLSHELRTPLSSILLQAQMLRQGEVSPAKLDSVYEVIERGARAQSQLIDDLLDASRIVSGRLQMEVQPCELCPVVLEAVESLGSAAQRRKVTLDVHVDQAIGQVWSDPARIRQVVLKLVGNAIKFTPAGGRVTVSLELQEGCAALRVSDTGAGIDAEFMPHLFERLWQQEGTITRRHGGLGVGLAIVRHVVESLGGSVSAYSAGVGQGSTFTATFPLTGFAREDAALERFDVAPVHSLDRPGKSRDYGELRGLRVLVLEDDPGTRKAVTEVFRLSGAVVRAASSTPEALRTFEAFGPQVMVCDIAMPERDGYDFIRELRARGPSRGGDTPALALTALSSEADRQRALAAGYQGHMAKPIDIDQLRDLVVQVLRATRAAPPS